MPPANCGPSAIVDSGKRGRRCGAENGPNKANLTAKRARGTQRADGSALPSYRACVSFLGPPASLRPLANTPQLPSACETYLLGMAPLPQVGQPRRLCVHRGYFDVNATLWCPIDSPPRIVPGCLKPMDGNTKRGRHSNTACGTGKASSRTLSVSGAEMGGGREPSSFPSSCVCTCTSDPTGLYARAEVRRCTIAMRIIVTLLGSIQSLTPNFRSGSHGHGPSRETVCRC